MSLTVPGLLFKQFSTFPLIVFKLAEERGILLCPPFEDRKRGGINCFANVGPSVRPSVRPSFGRPNGLRSYVTY